MIHKRTQMVMVYIHSNFLLTLNINEYVKCFECELFGIIWIQVLNWFGISCILTCSHSDHIIQFGGPTLFIKNILYNYLQI